MIDTPGMTGQHYGFEPRVDTRHEVATEALKSEIIPPGLTPMGHHKADRDG